MSSRVEAPARANLAGVSLEYRLAGEGEPIVLIHAGVCADFFQPLVTEPALADRFRTLTYHRAGYGGSDTVPGPLTVANQAAHCHALMRHLGIRQAHLVGHSSSAMMALQLALDAPEAVSTLALLDAARPAPATPLQQRFAESVAEPALAQYRAGDKSGAVDTWMRGVCGADYRKPLERALPGALERAVADADAFFAQELPAVWQWSFTAEDARRIEQPVLAVIGANSVPVFAERRRLLLDWLPDVEPFDLPGATHLLQLENAPGLAAALADFFARHPAAARSRSRQAPTVTSHRRESRSPRIAPPGAPTLAAHGVHSPRTARKANAIPNPAEDTMATRVQARDAMQFVNHQDPATLKRFIERLELRGKDPTFVAYREAYLKLIDLPRTGAVLELGCGTGVVTRAIATRDGFDGTVTGIDQSPEFIAAAERFATSDGIGDRVEFVVGDAHEPDFPAASFDAVVAHTLFSHVRDPQAVLAQAARVVRPGGTVAIFDGDYASLTFGCSDPRLGEAMEPALQSTIMSSPRVMRELPRLLAQAGLRLVAMQAHVYAEAGSSGFMLNLAETYAPLAGSSDQLDTEEVDAWLQDQRRAAEDGIFFAACNYYAYIARR